MSTNVPSNEFQIEEFSTSTNRETSSSSRLTSNDHFDDNAMDVDDMIKPMITTTATTKTAVNDEQLIWKPVTTKITVIIRNTLVFVIKSGLGLKISRNKMETNFFG